MPSFSDSAFPFSSDTNSLVEPPVKRDLDIRTANGKIPGFLCNIQFVVVTFLSARVEFMK